VPPSTPQSTEHPGNRRSLRHIPVRVATKASRHAEYADIIRELLDGPPA
jgi:Protein of unknown function (DUF664)